MSAAQGLPLGVPGPAKLTKTRGSEARANRPRLRLAAPAAGRVSRGPFALLVAAMLGLGLLGLLLLNTVLAQDAFVLHDLQGRVSQLTDQEQALQQQIDAEAAPSTLATRAAALGMVPSENPVFLRLSDGKVLGVPAPAKKPVPKPTPKPAASTPAASAAAAQPGAGAVTAAKKPAARTAAKPPVSATPAAQTGAAR